MRTLILILTLACSMASAWALDTQNRFSAYSMLSADEQILGVDWALELRQSYPLMGYTLDGEYSLFSKYQSRWSQRHEATMDAQSYRYYLSIKNPQSELRLGKQRLSFGSAQMLRPLQWFDRVDPLDPYQLTSGVEAALYRHYWLNNANLWLWGVLGTSERKGNEALGGKDDAPELGGRLQYPFAVGDMALSLHQRQLADGEEYRLGWDLRTDAILGVWLESSASYFDTALPIPEYRFAATLGADYVFDLGNGIATTLELMLLAIADSEPEQLRYQELVTAALISYPWSMLDSIQILGSYMQDAGNYQIDARWRRVYDLVALDLGLSRATDDETTLQLMITANF
jgi:hypothetical protein